MTPLIRMNIYLKKSIFSICLIICLTSLWAQEDIWNSEASLDYGNHLYNKGDYILAAQEYERYLYKHPENTDVVSRWIRAYAKGNKESIGLSELDSWRSNVGNQFDDLYYIEKTWLFIRLDNFAQHAENLRRSPVDWKYRRLHEATSVMLQGNWELAMHELAGADTPIEQKLYVVAKNAYNTKYKSPGLAAFLATIAPGTGKIYLGRYVDGLISMAFVGIMTYQAYRFFHVQGINSWPGWIYAGLGVGYYSAGIYGSVKAAKEYNEEIIQKYVNETNRILYSVY